MTDFLIAPVGKVYTIRDNMYFLPKALVAELIKDEKRLPVNVGDSKVGYATLSLLGDNLMASVTLTEARFTQVTQPKLQGTFIRAQNPEGWVLTHYAIESIGFPREATAESKSL